MIGNKLRNFKDFVSSNPNELHNNNCMLISLLAPTLRSPFPNKDFM